MRYSKQSVWSLQNSFDTFINKSGGGGDVTIILFIIFSNCSEYLFLIYLGKSKTMRFIIFVILIKYTKDKVYSISYCTLNF